MRLVVSSRKVVDIDVVAEIISANVLNFKSSFRVSMSVLSFLNPSRLNVATWKGQMGVCELKHMCI